MTDNDAALQGENETRYYDEVVERVVRGETVWARRNFDAELAVFDLYVNKKSVGCVIQEESGGYGGYFGDDCVTGSELVAEDIARGAVRQAYDMSVEQV